MTSWLCEIWVRITASQLRFNRRPSRLVFVSSRWSSLPAANIDESKIAICGGVRGDIFSKSLELCSYTRALRNRRIKKPCTPFLPFWRIQIRNGACPLREVVS